MSESPTEAALQLLNELQEQIRLDRVTVGSVGPIADVDDRLFKFIDVWEDTQRLVHGIVANSCRERNRLVPASKLPAEILCRVLLYASAEHSRTVLSLAQTCAFWRETAFRYPHAWSHLQMGPSKLGLLTVDIASKVFLPLSDKRPIELDYHWEKFPPIDPRMTRKRTGFWTREAHRAKIVRLTIAAVPLPTSLDTLRSALRTQAESLETLEICQDLNYGTAQPHVLDLGKEAFKAKTPKLRSLILTNTRFPWASPLYKGLTTLFLELNHIKDTTTYTETKSILDVFKNAPRLQEIDIYLTAFSLGEPYFVDPSVEPEPIPLKHARKVHFSLTRHDMAFLLLAIALPEHLDGLALHTIPAAPIACVLPPEPQYLPCFNNITSAFIDFEARVIFVEAANPSAKDQLSANGAASKNEDDRSRMITLKSGLPDKDYWRGPRYRKPEQDDAGREIPTRLSDFVEVLEVIDRVHSLDSLKKITLSGVDGPWLSANAIEDLLRCAPAVQTLVVAYCAEAIVELLTDEMHRPGCTVEYLEFAHMKVEEEELRDLFAQRGPQMLGINLNGCTMIAEMRDDVEDTLDAIKSVLDDSHFTDLKYSIADEEEEDEEENTEEGGVSSTSENCEHAYPQETAWNKPGPSSYSQGESSSLLV